MNTSAAAIHTILTDLARSGGLIFPDHGPRCIGALAFEHSSTIAGLAETLGLEAATKAREDHLASESRQLGALSRRAARAEKESKLAFEAGRTTDAERWAAQAQALRSEAAAIGLETDGGVGGPAGYAPLGRPAGGARGESSGDVEKLRLWVRALSHRRVRIEEIATPRLSLDAHAAMLAKFGGVYIDVPEAARAKLMEAASEVLRKMGRNGRVLAADAAGRRLRTAIMQTWIAMSAGRPTFSISSHRTFRGEDATTYGAFHDFVRSIENATMLGTYSILARADWGDWPEIYRLISKT